MCGNCGNCGKPGARVDLQHLPTPLLSHIFVHLDHGTRPAWSASCQALRVAALHALGRAMVRRTLVMGAASGCWEVAPPAFLRTLTMLHELVVHLDASVPGVEAEDVLAALSTVLACLPHCRRSGGSPQLHLCLHVVLPHGRPLPELEAFRLQHLLADLGLLHGIERVQLDSPCFTLDGGLAGLLCSARLSAEHHLLEGLAASDTYHRLRSLDLDLGSGQALEDVAALVRGGLFPGLRRLRLARQYAADAPGLPWDPVQLGCREGLLTSIAQARGAAYEAGAYDSGGEERPPSPTGAPPLAPPNEMQRLRLQPAQRSGEPCRLCGRGWGVCTCPATYSQLLHESHTCHTAADLSFLAHLPKLAALELANFALAEDASRLTLPQLPALTELALTQEPWFQRQPGLREANRGGSLALALATAFPALRRLRMDGVCCDDGVSELRGLTSLAFHCHCGRGPEAQREPFHGFSWEACRLQRLEELHLRGGYGWLEPGASWRGALLPKGFAFSGCGRLRRLVFDVRGWGQLPRQPQLEALLAAVLGRFINTAQPLPSLTSVHAVLEDGPYCPSKNDGYFAQEGPLGEWGAVYDGHGDLWGAVLAAEQTPKVVLMELLAREDGSGGGAGDSWGGASESEGAGEGEEEEEGWGSSSEGEGCS